MSRSRRFSADQGPDRAPGSGLSIRELGPVPCSLQCRSIRPRPASRLVARDPAAAGRRRRHARDAREGPHRRGHRGRGRAGRGGHPVRAHQRTPAPRHVDADRAPRHPHSHRGLQRRPARGPRHDGDRAAHDPERARPCDDRVAQGPRPGRVALSGRRLVRAGRGRPARRPRGRDRAVPSNSCAPTTRAWSRGSPRSWASSDDHDAVARAATAAQERFGEHVSAARSQPYYVDVTHPQANKGSVVEYLARRYDIPSEQIATIGDMPNDVLMFARSGLPIAMGNSDREVQRAARRVTGPNDARASPKRVRRSCSRARPAILGRWPRNARRDARPRASSRS